MLLDEAIFAVRRAAPLDVRERERQAYLTAAPDIHFSLSHFRRASVR
ncbi:MAG: hypothetical protein ACLUDF_02815 [Butyricicoccus sp.]